MPLTYRPDIDGLRTIAVFSVVLFHLGVPGVPGGFVGVDIFFVISGYLITSLLEKDHAGGGISFAKFYARRAKRLLPAGFAVIAFTLGVGWLLYGSREYDELGLSAAAAAVFFANFHFADRTDYFDAPAHDHPLLHTWSLSVEEQFYLIWPLMLIVLLRYRQRPVVIVSAIAALMAASFVTAIITTERAPAAAFFYLPGRFWELLLGAALALCRHDVKLSAVQAQASGLAGMGLVLLGIFTISDGDPFPGWRALLPCVGTALLILSGLGPQSLTSRLLAARPMVLGGLISYSLYLWHWPLLVFYRQWMNLGQLDVAAMAGLLVVSVGIATLSYRYIEQPVRRMSSARLPNARALRIAGLSTLAVAGLAVSVHLSGGLPGRLPPQVLALDEVARAHHPRFAQCHGMRATPKHDALCAFGADKPQDAPFDLLLMGDSHADHFAPTIEKWATDKGWKGRQITANACPPLLGVRRFDPANKDHCDPIREVMRRYLDDAPKVVVLAARWSLYTEPVRIDGNANKPVALGWPGEPRPDMEKTRQVLRESLTRLVDELTARNIRVLLLGQVPPHKFNPNFCLLRRVPPDDPGQCGVASDKVRTRLARTDKLLSDLAAASALVDVILPSNHMCEGPTCMVMLDGTPLYINDNHLNGVGGAAVYELLPFDELN